MNKYFDHTLLKADATKDQITKVLNEAREYNFASVCVNPTWVAYAKERLTGTDVKVCTVIGFPLGGTTTEVKAFEAKNAERNGATEVDMVISIGQLKSQEYHAVAADIKGVVTAVKESTLVKVIIETALLTEAEKIKVCQLAKEAGADFVKTSTGFSTSGATVADVSLMRQTVGENIGVKASGGINNGEDLKKMIQAGANRIGTSSSVEILTNQVANTEAY